jgi:hypothetical protein
MERVLSIGGGGNACVSSNTNSGTGRRLAAVADDVVDDFHANDGGQSLGLATRLQAAETATLLSDVAAFVRRFVVLSQSQTVAVALWVLHTWTVHTTDSTMYVWIRSAVKQSGKTRLLEVLELLVLRPWFTSRTSAAALVRKIDGQAPTLLLDESDTAFGGNQEYAEVLRGTLNSGHRRGGRVSVCVGQGATITVQDFSTYCPKALAGLSVLPDTVADRSIPIILKRRNKLTEPVERFRRRDADEQFAPVRERLAVWSQAVAPLLTDARPEIPWALSDRAAEGWECLLAIAELGGGDWSVAARQAAVALHADQTAKEESAGVMLLQAIRETFEARGVDRISTADLLRALVKRDDGPWADLWGRQVAAGEMPGPASKLGRLLRPFGITPRTVRFESDRAKGYLMVDFDDAFARYIAPVEGRDSVTVQE